MTDIIPDARTVLSPEQRIALAYEVTQLDLDRALKLEEIAVKYGALSLYAEEINALRDPERFETRQEQAKRL